MKIYTQCSHCETVFAVTETQMAHKSGWVRCGHCKEPFNAYAQRLSDPIDTDSFIDPDAEFAGGLAAISQDAVTEMPADDEDLITAEQPREWTNFELILDHDEDETWEDADDDDAGDGAGDEDSSGLTPATELDLDYSGIEADEGPTQPADDSGDSENGADSKPAEAHGDGEVVSTGEDGETEPTQDAVRDEPGLSSPGQTEGQGSREGAVENSPGTGGESDEDQPPQSAEPPVEIVVKPYPGAGTGGPLEPELTEEQEVTIDPVFTIEENYYDFTRQARRTGRRWPRVIRVILSVIVLLLLASLLVWQLFQRYGVAWSQNTTLRPAIVQWCSVAGCPVPPLRDIRLVELVGTSISTHDEVAGALLVTIQLINRAEYEQAYPALEVSLTDREGSVVGRRTLAPREFLGLDGGEGGLPSRQLISIVLDLASPPATAVGYEVRIIDI